MDSLTQIVLGAACGEIALGKKIGNKALLYGAIAGTIPDLDVIVGNLIYENDIDSLAFHRGFMHSILFAVIGSLGLGWLSFKLNQSKNSSIETSVKDWYWLFFTALFTHTILDCFTQYGTQLFSPFSDYRVAFNTISVVDPLYTIPFLFCIIVLMFKNRMDKQRRLWLKAGLIISSAYLILTIVNKLYVDRIFRKSIDRTEIKVHRFRTQPTFANNLLWYGIAEDDNNYYGALYSLLDKDPTIKTWKTIPKSHSFVDLEEDRMKTLIWFSDGYFNIFKSDTTNQLIYYDLRYPSFDPDTPESSLFKFNLIEKNGTYNVRQDFNSWPSEKQLSKFYDRIKGI